MNLENLTKASCAQDAEQEQRIWQNIKANLASAGNQLKDQHMALGDDAFWKKCTQEGISRRSAQVAMFHVGYVAQGEMTRTAPTAKDPPPPKILPKPELLKAILLCIKAEVTSVDELASYLYGLK